MKNQNLKLLALLIVVVAAVLVGCFKEEVEKSQVDEITQQIQTPSDQEVKVITYSSNVIPDQYIVVYKAEVASDRGLTEKSYVERNNIMREVASQTMERYRISTEKVDRVYSTAIKGFSAKLTVEELDALKSDSQIDFIEQDQIMSVNMGGPPGGNDPPPPQVIPWGIARIGGASSGLGLRAWIIDSGIDLDHPDLNVNTALSESFLGGNQADNPDDQNGHGTHVAGTVAAVDNDEGVIGVAAGAEVVSVRVLDRRGSGSTSGVINGVDYVAANAASADAANMSLGGGTSTALDNAVIGAAGAGGCNCPFSLAAGNESDDANNHSPARANGPNIYTISSMDSSDNWSYFSNYGNPPVDYCAPGSSIYSTYKNGGYATLSGTSMAAPHVCGLLLLGNVTTDGTVNGDPDGNPDDIAHN